mmetsp:Transcript_109792/g.218047  ORF Transcript_109792/g.218047 Transcript_109792/m.218047 type:complete len:310 (-) Transcript_109792:577-1506(-)
MCNSNLRSEEAALVALCSCWLPVLVGKLYAPLELEAQFLPKRVSWEPIINCLRTGHQGLFQRSGPVTLSSGCKEAIEAVSAALIDRGTRREDLSIWLTAGRLNGGSHCFDFLRASRATRASHANKQVEHHRCLGSEQGWHGLEERALRINDRIRHFASVVEGIDEHHVVLVVTRSGCCECFDECLTTQWVKSKRLAPSTTDCICCSCRHFSRPQSTFRKTQQLRCSCDDGRIDLHSVHDHLALGKSMVEPNWYGSSAQAHHQRAHARHCVFVQLECSLQVGSCHCKCAHRLGVTQGHAVGHLYRCSIAA